MAGQIVQLFRVVRRRSHLSEMDIAAPCGNRGRNDVHRPPPLYRA